MPKLEIDSEIAGVEFTSLCVHKDLRRLLHRLPDKHTSAVSEHSLSECSTHAWWLIDFPKPALDAP